jgi:hypothetical protein
MFSKARIEQQCYKQMSMAISLPAKSMKLPITSMPDTYLHRKESGGSSNSSSRIEIQLSNAFKFICPATKIWFFERLKMSSPLWIVVGSSKTTLTEFFTANKKAKNEAAAAVEAGDPLLDLDCRDLLYQEFPLQMTWDREERKWNRRKPGVGGTIGRIYFVGPNGGERFYLRMLLTHIRRYPVQCI